MEVRYDVDGNVLTDTIRLVYYEIGTLGLIEREGEIQDGSGNAFVNMKNIFEIFAVAYPQIREQLKDFPTEEEFRNSKTNMYTVTAELDKWVHADEEAGIEAYKTYVDIYMYYLNEFDV